MKDVMFAAEICRVLEVFSPELVKMESSKDLITVIIKVSKSSPLVDLISSLPHMGGDTDSSEFIERFLVFDSKYYFNLAVNPYIASIMFGNYGISRFANNEIIIEHNNSTLFPQFKSIEKRNKTYYLVPREEIILYKSKRKENSTGADYIESHLLKLADPIHQPSITLVRYFEFEACHRLNDYCGKCSNLHGHTYKVEYGIIGKINAYTKMVIDFGELKKIEKIIDDIYDHKMLNEINEKVAYRPTAEVLAVDIFDMIEEYLPPYAIVDYVRLWETSNSSVSYSG